jgi:GNAT superfamily N-acetyltransferase
MTDADALAVLLRRIGNWEHINSESTESTVKRVTDHLRLALSDGSHLVLLAEAESDHAVGYLSVHWLPYLFLKGPEGYVSELFVSAECRGQGIGKGLLARATEEARARGCSRLMLLNIRDRESYKRQFYAKQGWTERPDAANFVYRL